MFDIIFFSFFQIFLELLRKDGSRCHDGAIHQLAGGEGELGRKDKSEEEEKMGP